MSFSSGSKGAVGGGEGGEKRVPREIETEIVAELSWGEIWIIPMESLGGGGKTNGLVGDPAGKSSWRDLIPAEALPSEESGGAVERAGELEGWHGRALV